MRPITATYSQVKNMINSGQNVLADVTQPSSLVLLYELTDPACILPVLLMLNFARDSSNLSKNLSKSAPSKSFYCMKVR